MNKFLIVIVTLLLASVYGCGNLSPRNKERNNNQGADIDSADKITQGFKNEIATLRHDLDIANSQIAQLQQGTGNHQNSGVEIFSGQGGLFLGLVGIIAISVVTVTTFHYRSEANKNGKAASLLAEQIVKLNNHQLENEVFLAAMQTNVQDKVLQFMKAQQQRLR